MKSVVLEVTTLADAVTKAHRVAPTKGAAFDRASGIVIDIDPDRVGEQCIIKATDLEVTIRLGVNTLRLGDEPVIWRVPAKLMYGLISSLPMSGGAEIELLDTGDGNLYLKSGKTKGKLRQIVGDFPKIEKYGTAEMVNAPNLSARLAQVAWATDKRGSGVLSGVHIDGEFLYGCNRASVAIVPCKVALVEPVTAPLTEVSQIIRNTGEVSVRATDAKLLLMPDEHTQASCVLYGEPYPKILPLIEKAKLAFTFNFNAEALLGMIDRTLVLMKEERLPSTVIEIGDGYLKMTMSTEAGLVIDELDIDGGDQEPLKLSFSPEALRSAIAASGRPMITAQYGPTGLDPLLLSDDNGFRALMMPIRTS